MARYYRHNPVEYESMFVPLPLDLFAAKMQQSQQGYEQFATMKGQFEDEFRKINRLPVDIEKTNERLKTEYVQEFNNLVDKSNGDISTMASGLKNLHRKFQEDLQYGKFGAIQGNYNAYIKQKEDIEKRFADDKISMNAKLLALDLAYEDFANAKGTQDLGNGKFSSIQFPDVVGKWDRKALTDQMDKVREDSTAYKSSINGETIGGSQSWVTRNKLTTAGLQWLEADDLYQKNLDYDFEVEHRGDTEEQLKNHFTQTDANGKSYYDLLVEGRNSLQQDYTNASKKPGFTNNDAYVYGENIRYYNNLIDKLDKGDYAGARELEWKRERSLSDIASDVTANETSSIKTTYGYVNKEGFKDVVLYGHNLDIKTGNTMSLKTGSTAPEEKTAEWDEMVNRAEAGGEDGRSKVLRSVMALGGPKAVLSMFVHNYVGDNKSPNELLYSVAMDMSTAKTPQEAAAALSKYTGQDALAFVDMSPKKQGESDAQYTARIKDATDKIEQVKEAVIPALNDIRTDMAMDLSQEQVFNDAFMTEDGSFKLSEFKNALHDYDAPGMQKVVSTYELLKKQVDRKDGKGAFSYSEMRTIVGESVLNDPRVAKYITVSNGVVKFSSNMSQEAKDLINGTALTGVVGYAKEFSHDNPSFAYDNAGSNTSYGWFEYSGDSQGIKTINGNLNNALKGRTAADLLSTDDPKGTEFIKLGDSPEELAEWDIVDGGARYTNNQILGNGWATVTVKNRDSGEVKTLRVKMSRLSDEYTDIICRSPYL